MLVFCADEISVTDITALIDKGYRFSVVFAGEEKKGLMNVEDYLNGEVGVPDLGGVQLRQDALRV